MNGSWEETGYLETERFDASVSLPMRIQVLTDDEIRAWRGRGAQAIAMWTGRGWMAVWVDDEADVALREPKSREVS